MPQVKPAIVKRMPFIDIELNNQKPFIELSNKLTDLKKELQVVKTPQDEKLLKIQIGKVDNQINNKVYELYDLTEDEIKIIEDSLNL